MECFLLTPNISTPQSLQLINLDTLQQGVLPSELCTVFFDAPTHFRIAVMPTSHLAESTLESAPRPAFSAILHAVSAALLSSSAPACHVLLPTDQIRDIVLLFQDATTVVPRCRDIMEQVEQSAGVSLSIGLGSVAKSIKEIPASLQSARENAYSFNLFSPQSDIYTDALAQSRSRPYDLTKEEDSLYAAVLNGSDAAIRAAVQHLTDCLFDNGFFCLRQLNRLELLYHGMRINWMEKFRIRNPKAEKGLAPPAFYFSSGFDEHGVFSIERFQLGLCHDLHETALFYRRLSEQQTLGVRFLEQVKEYIDFSYMLPLSQDHIAAQFYISANYLGKIYKSHFGIGMVQYINEVRIRRACELLTGSTLPINRISAQTGFLDEKYFSRVFRKIIGCSPRDYRAGGKKIESVKATYEN